MLPLSLFCTWIVLVNGCVVSTTPPGTICGQFGNLNVASGLNYEGRVQAMIPHVEGSVQLELRTTRWPVYL